ncbi:MAG: hypothetical protein AMXMBFR64_52380 [Myxococcales bacterium]
MDWFRVTCDEEEVRADVAPPGGVAWSRAIRWGSVERVCFEAGGLWESDTWYLFERGEPHSLMIPSGAPGTGELLDALMARGLFPAELAIRAATGEGLTCWPTE